MATLKRHLAGVDNKRAEDHVDIMQHSAVANEMRLVDVPDPVALFEMVVRLHVGEALVFSPSAMIALECQRDEVVKVKTLSSRCLKISVRNRLSADGGISVMAD